ncbi:hypothetical protein BV20DRAFT_1052208 [Pilatotrama ljubarskyi]|nr:hypothetical protein BV20DRAFT_1052208 [Pilatotrama ljubarskyi]
MPRLEDLRIGLPSEPDGPDAPDLGLVFSRFPSLRRLSLTDVCVPPGISGLTSLYIHEGKWGISLPQLLDALERCPVLEYLTMNYYFRWSLPNDFPKTCHLPIISLSRLRELEIQGANSNETAAILRHVHIPSVKCLRLIGNLDRVVDPDLPLIAIGSLFPPERTVIQRVFPRLSGPASITVRILYDDFSIRCTTPNEHVELSLYSEFID